MVLMEMNSELKMTEFPPSPSFFPFFSTFFRVLQAVVPYIQTLPPRPPHSGDRGSLWTAKTVRKLLCFPKRFGRGEIAVLMWDHAHLSSNWYLVRRNCTQRVLWD